VRILRARMPGISDASEDLDRLNNIPAYEKSIPTIEKVRDFLVAELKRRKMPMKNVIDK